MGRPRGPEKAILFSGLLYHKNKACQRALKELEKVFGPFVFVSKQLIWDHSEYYRWELGWPIYRRFVLFDRLIDPIDIVDIKLKSNALEDALSIDQKRTVNIDPGYITLSKLVLATTKNYAHRIYLGKGIYGEVTLYYRKGRFIEHSFTYKDYQSPEYKAIFEQMREVLKNKLQG